MEAAMSCSGLASTCTRACRRRVHVDDGLGHVDREEIIVREAHQAAERITPQEDRSRSQKLLVRMFGRLDPARVLTASVSRLLLCLREIGQVILVESLEKRVGGILQLVDGITALRMSYDHGIASARDGSCGNKRIVAYFKTSELGALLP